MKIKKELIQEIASYLIYGAVIMGATLSLSTCVTNHQVKKAFDKQIEKMELIDSQIKDLEEQQPKVIREVREQWLVYNNDTIRAKFTYNGKER